MLQRYVGVTPRWLREQGGSAWVVRAFAARVTPHANAPLALPLATQAPSFALRWKGGVPVDTITVDAHL
jgi:hypothetical protein